MFWGASHSSKGVVGSSRVVGGFPREISSSKRNLLNFGRSTMRSFCG